MHTKKVPSIAGPHRHSGSRAIVAPVGRWGTDLHGELAFVEGAQHPEQPTAGRDLIPLYARSAARNGRKSLTRAPWRGGKSLAVELPGVEFGGAHRAPEDGTKRV